MRIRRCIGSLLHYHVTPAVSCVFEPQVCVHSTLQPQPLQYRLGLAPFYPRCVAIFRELRALRLVPVRLYFIRY
jgi:hypothetical protein